MSTVARVSAEINLKDDLTTPLKKTGKNVSSFADRAGKDLEKTRATWKRFGDEVTKTSKKMQTAGVALSAGLTAPILLAARKAVMAASDLQESLTKTQAVFIDSTHVVSKFAETSAGSFGLARQAALDYASSFGLILQAGGKTEAQSAGMSVVLAKLSADLASFYNVDLETAATKLKSGLVGEAEPLRAFGVLLSETAVAARALAMGFKEEGGTLSETAKVQARYAIILEQTRKAQGDFAKTSDGLANQSRILKANVADLAAEFGEVLLPYVQRAVKAVGDLVEKFRALSPESKKVVVQIAAFAAAIGPLLIVFGTAGSLIGGLATGFAAVGKIVSPLAPVLANAGGALGLIRTALLALTGPVGVAVALVAGLVIAWKTNFLGLQDIFLPVLRRIAVMFGDLYSNIRDTMTQIYETVVDAWTGVVRAAQPIIDFFVGFVQYQWAVLANAIEVTLRFVTDLLNSSLAGWRIAFGAGWSDISNTMKASLLRMRSIAVTILADIAQFVVNGFRAITAVNALVPGLSALSDKVLSAAQARIDALRAEAGAARYLAGNYDALADAERKRIAASGAPSKPNPFVAGATPPGTPFGGGAGSKAKKAAKDNANPELERQKRVLEQIAQIQRELNAEKMKADELEVDAQKKAAEAIKAKQDAYRDLNRAVGDAAAGFQKEREQLHFTTKEEAARWEVTHGGYKDASGFAQALFVLQARLLDQATRAKAAQEKWAAFWEAVRTGQKEWVADQQKVANERYEEYLHRLTEEMLKLSGATEKVLRADLTEQFKGMAAGAKTVEEGAARVRKAVDDIMGTIKDHAELAARIAMIRDVASKIEDIFRRSLDNLFENGFKNFFRSVTDGFRDLARQIAVEFAQIQLMKALMWGVGQLFGAGTAAGIAGALPKKAMGGNVFGRQPTIVGENGPEVFIPGGSGRIMRNDESGRVGGSSTNITVNLSTPSYHSFRRSEGQSIAQVFGRAARARAREGR